MVAALLRFNNCMRPGPSMSLRSFSGWRANHSPRPIVTVPTQFSWLAFGADGIVLVAVSSQHGTKIWEY